MISANDKTLRDYFAAKAMQSITLANRTIGTNDKLPTTLAREAYEIADAMMKEKNNVDEKLRENNKI